MSIAEKLTTIAENEQRVYEAGVTAEHDRFWDSCQQKGTRTDYRYAFCYGSWHSGNFYPKYDIKPTGDASYMFTAICWGSWTGFSLKKRLADCGVKLDTSGVTNATQMFNSSKFTELPTIDLTKATSIGGAFAYSDVLVTIEKLIISENTGTLGSGALSGCTKLANITFEGVIAKNTNVSSLTALTHESLISLLNTLKDLSGTGTTLTLTLGATLLAKLTDAEKVVATEKGWTLS